MSISTCWALKIRAATAGLHVQAACLILRKKFNLKCINCIRLRLLTLNLQKLYMAYHSHSTRKTAPEVLHKDWPVQASPKQPSFAFTLGVMSPRQALLGVKFSMVDQATGERV